MLSFEQLTQLRLKARDRISIGSKSFKFASFFMPSEIRSDIYLLYSWCRYCDDEIDHLPKSATQNEKIKKLELLRNSTLQAIEGKTDLSEPFLGIAYVVHRYGIPLHYPLLLLEGMEMDLYIHQYPTLALLESYCYRVAGVVGLMMCYIMQVSDEKALLSACRLGMAMQLTNIARDVYEDAQIGRTYLPADLLAKHGVEQDSMFEAGREHQTFLAIRAIHQLADNWYQQGRSGIQFLPLACGYSILVAASVYQAIGKRLCKSKDPNVIRERVYVPLVEKLKLSLSSFFRMFTIAINRMSFQWQPVSIGKLWIPV